MRRFGGIVCFAVYLAVAVWATWPLSQQLTTATPLGTEQCATVPLLNVWTVWWNADRLQHGYAGYWDAPIFHPTPNAFALSEPMIPTGVAAPLVWWFRDPIPAYNSLLLFVLALNGFSTFQLLRRRELHWLPAFCGGLCVELLPFVHWQLGVLQLVPLFGIVWTIDALWCFRERPSVGFGLALGAAFALTYWFCCHYGLFLSVLLLVGSLWFLWPKADSKAEIRNSKLEIRNKFKIQNSKHETNPEVPIPDGQNGFGSVCCAGGHVSCLGFRISSLFRISDFAFRVSGTVLRLRAVWLGLLVALVVCVVLVYPVVYVQQQVMMRDEGFRRPEDLMKRLSARITHYAVPPWPQLRPLPVAATDPGERQFPLCPGMVKLGLAVLGATVGLFRRRLRRWTAFCLTVALVALMLSFGLRVQLGGWSPYQVLIDWYPGFAQVRNVFRFAVFVQLMVALMAAVGLQGIWQAARRLLRVTTVTRTVMPRAVEFASFNAQPKAPALTNATASEAGAFGWALNERDGPSCARHTFRETICFMVVLAIGLVAAVEIRPPSQHVFVPPKPQENRLWLDWLVEHTPRDAVLACVPFPKGRKATDYQETAVWMYWQTFHGRRMVNGYSGFFPRTFLDLKPLVAGFPHPKCLDRLQQLGVDYCVVRRSAVKDPAILRDPRMQERLIWLFGDDQAEIDIFLLRKREMAEEAEEVEEPDM